MTHRQLLRRTAILLATLLLAGGCSEEDLPSSPPPPFLFTSLSLSSDTQPRPGTFLAQGEAVRLRYGVSYTLDPSMDQQRNQLALYVNVFGVAADSSTVNIGAFPDREYRPDVPGEFRSDTLDFTVPNGVTQVWVEAFLDTLPFSNPVLALDRLIWPVR
jgi:hypothetical protein